MEILPGFFKNMMRAREVEVVNGGRQDYTLPELTTYAAMEALDIASVGDQDAAEIDRRAELLRRSGAYSSAIEKSR